MDKWLLIKQKSNWADEFDTAGFTIMTQEEWDLYVYQAMNCLQYPKESYVGTNQEIEIDNCYDYMRSFTVEEILYEEVLFLRRMFKGHSDLDGFYHSYGMMQEIVDGCMEEEFCGEHGFIGIEHAKIEISTWENGKLNKRRGDA